MAPLFLDMDNVITDFDQSAADVHGWTLERLAAARPLGHWSLTEPLGVTLDEFWAPIHAEGERFWFDMDTLPWADDLLALIKRLDWHLVSAPSRCVTSYIGKYRWINHNIPQQLGKAYLMDRKELLAGPGRILIDDREANIDKWTKAGGIGIIFPSHGNRLHELRHDPLPYVQRHLEMYDALKVQ